MADRSSKERREMEEKRLRKLSFTLDSDSARAYRLSEKCEVRFLAFGVALIVSTGFGTTLVL